MAGEAGVDAALVHHYFGSEDDLFVAALELPLDPRMVIGPSLAGGLDGAAERLLTCVRVGVGRPHHAGVAAGGGGIDASGSISRT